MKKFLLILFFAILICKPAFAKTKAFQYEAKDGFNMTGIIYLPKVKPKQKVPVVVLLHAIGSSKENWRNLPNMIMDKGYACLALDLRGHGQSVLNSKLKQRSWMYFTNKDYAKYPGDVMSAIDALNAQYKKKIDTENIIFVGNHIGANTAVLVASKLNRKKNAVKSIVMISPSVKIKNLFIPIEIVNFGPHPVLIFANKHISTSYRDAYEIKKYAQGKCEVKALDSSGMGAALYKSTPSIQTDTFNWIVSVFDGQNK